MILGQINRGSQLGEVIYNMCNQDDIKSIVEIGTWNGMGSTKCIYESLVNNNKKDYVVYTLESNQTFYNQAVSNLPKLENFNMILGRIIEIDEVVDIDKCDDVFFTCSNRSDQKGWLAEDLYNYGKIENVLGLLPESIDLLILDGGEFSNYYEYLKLKDRTKYFILDDTKSIKNFDVANIMRTDSSYQVLIDSNDRGGFLVSKKIV